MKTLKTILIAAVLFCSAGIASAQYELTGDVNVNAVSNALVYQGRLERNGSPVSDSDISNTSFQFAIFNKESGGGSPTIASCACNDMACDTNKLKAYSEDSQNPKCLWLSSYVSTKVVSGIFSVHVNTPWEVFRYAGDKYIEIIVGNQVMTPREKIASVPYALIAKKLENNATIKVSSITIAPGGNIFLNDGCVYFNNNGHISNLCSSTTASAIDSVQGNNVRLIAGTDIYFQTGQGHDERIRILENGNVGIGTNSPDKNLTVNGDMKVTGSFYGNGGKLRVSDPLYINNGQINDGAITIGTDNIVLKAPGSGNSNQLYLSSAGYVGVGTANPAYPLDVKGVLHVSSNQGLRTGKITLGADSGNVIKGVNSSDHIFLQKEGSKAVGIGTLTPRSKLEVAGGIMADSMTVTGNTIFNGDVIMRGPKFIVSNDINTTVTLPSTVIHGNLTVTGGIGTTEGTMAYLDRENNFLLPNAFNKEVTVSSNVYVYKRAAIASSGFSFGNNDERYLQIGDGSSSADIYLIGGSAANAALRLYRAGAEVGRISTDGNNLNFLVNGSTVSVLSGDSYNVKQSFMVGNSSLPALYVKGSSVSINAAEPDAESLLTVNGQLYAHSIRFPDNSVITSSASIGSPTGIQANGNITINSGSEIDFIINNGDINDDTNKVMVIKDGKVGIATGSAVPKATLHVNGSILLGSSNTEIPSGTLSASGGVYASENIKTAGGIYTGGTERITSSGNIQNAVWNGNTVGVQYGGTGLTGGSSGILKGNGSSYSIGKANLSSSNEVTGILSVANGGTGHNHSSSTGLLRANSTEIITGPIYLDTGMGDVTGVLSVANGGTGQNLASLSGIIKNYGNIIGTGTVNLAASANEVEGILPVANGGTGRSSYTANRILYTSAANVIGELALPKGRILMGGNGGTPVAGLVKGDNATGVIVDTDTAGVISVKTAQSLVTSANPVFAGLKLTGINPKNAFLKINDAGNVYSVAQLNMSDFTGMLPVANGGTGRNASFFSANPGPLYSFGNGLISTNTINMETEVTGILPIANGGTGISSLASNKLVYSNGTSLATLNIDSGKILIGQTSGVPVAANLTGTANQVIVTPGSGSITLSLPQNIHTTASPTFSGLTLSALSNGILKANSGVISASQINLASSSDITGLLPVSKGGTNQNLSGKTGLLRSYSTFIGTGTVNINQGTTDISGVLPIANGGTGVNSISSSGGKILKVVNGSSIAGGKVSLAATNEVTGILPVSRGGTGQNSFNANSVLLASGTNALTSVTLSAGNVLMGNSSGGPSAGVIESSHININTATSGKIILSLPQNINNSAVVRFSSVTASGDLTGANAKISGTINAQNAIVSGSLSNPGKLILAQKTCNYLRGIKSTAATGTIVYCSDCDNDSKILVNKGGSWSNMAGSGKCN